MSTPQQTKYFLIKLLQIQITNQAPKQQQNPIYFSFNYDQNMHFSSCMPNEAGILADDIILDLDYKNISNIQMCRWQNHMIMFTHDIDLSQIKTRNTLVKQIQTKSGEILKFLILALKQHEIQFGNKYISSITQHYLLINQAQLITKQIIKNQQNQASYLRIKAQNNSYVLPVINSRVLLKLPQILEFQQVKNGKVVGRSSKYKSQQLGKEEIMIQLDSMNGYKYSNCVKLVTKWGINLLQAKPQNTLLLGTQQVMIYEIQVKFDNPAQYGSSRVKILNGNKAFDLGNQFNSAKPAKIKKIIHLVVKNQDEQIVILVQKNNKAIAQAKFMVEQIVPLTMHLMKKKIIDYNGKMLGAIRFKCQKAKNLSNPTNDKFWRESGKSKTSSGLLLIFDQVSVKFSEDAAVCLSLKTQSDQKLIKNIPNFTYFNKDQHVSISPISLILKQDESVYMILKDQNSALNQSDFIGIALFNCSTIRLGMNCIQLKFFKNQTHTITLNCICHKIVSYPFLKPTFQSQLLQPLSHRSLSLSVIMRQIYFSPYFYTYRYDSKSQVYCIVQINKIKKVLIIQNKNKSNQLYFNVSASSDNLEFSIQQTQIIKMKITFLVSDIGQDQEIYGFSFIKIKASQLESATASLKFYLVQIKNDFQSNLGQINLEVHKASLFNSHQKQSRDILQSGNNKAKILQGQKRRLKMHLAQISQSVQLKQKQNDMAKNQNKQPIVKKNFELPQTKKSSSRYQKSPGQISILQRKKRNNSVIGIEGALKLPPIRQESASPAGKKSYNQLIQMMKVRKRSVKGSYQQNSMLESYQFRDYHKKSILPHKYEDPIPHENIHLKQKIEKQNPNLYRNMQILFPKRSARMQKSSVAKRPISEQQKKLKGLKSVLNQISSDMGQIEPTVKDQQQYGSKQKNNLTENKNQDMYEPNNLKGPEWDDNQFLV